jgi:hypothetical protein
MCEAVFERFGQLGHRAMYVGSTFTTTRRFRLRITGAKIPRPHALSTERADDFVWPQIPEGVLSIADEVIE